MALRDFSDEEIRLLKLVVQREKQRNQNTPSRPSQDRSYDENQDWMTPELYIAKPTTEVSGLEAGTGTGTGDGIRDVAGSGIVDIYRIIEDDNGNPRLVNIFEHPRDVYNLTGGALGDSYVALARDKFGRWITIPLTQFNFVRFRIDEMIPEGATGTEGEIDGLRTAICTPLSKICGGMIPGMDENGKIRVVDALGCVFNESDEDLENNRLGYAAYMGDLDVLGTGTVEDPDTGTAPSIGSACRWEVPSFCCLLS